MTHRSRNPDVVRYAIYARTAAGGAEKVRAQIKAARAAVARQCRDQDSVTIKEYQDINVGGISDAPGPGLSSLLHDAAEGVFDVVLVTDLTRLSRSAIRFRDIVAAIELAGARVACVEDIR